MIIRCKFKTREKIIRMKFKNIRNKKILSLLLFLSFFFLIIFDSPESAVCTNIMPDEISDITYIFYSQDNLIKRNIVKIIPMKFIRHPHYKNEEAKLFFGLLHTKSIQIFSLFLSPFSILRMWKLLSYKHHQVNPIYIKLMHGPILVFIQWVQVQRYRNN